MPVLSGGASEPTTYTRPSMTDSGPDAEPGSTAIEGAVAEARDALVSATSRIRSAADRIREAHADNLAAPEAGGADAARARQALARLDVAARDMEGALRYLDDGVHPRPGAAAHQIIEAQEEERSRLAEELHDGPAQALSNAALQVEIIDRALRSDPEMARTELASLRRSLDRELERMRDYIHQLRPDLDESGGLAVAIEEIADAIRAESDMQVLLDLTAPEDWLDLAAQTAVLRITQEALRNARKHADASTVQVLTWVENAPDEPTPAAWVLEVRDNGRGFPADQAPDRGPRRHFGLRFMRERARLVGATLDIKSHVDGGTTVRLEMDPRERS